MLEKMDVFFENRLSGYDEHMMLTVDGANEFYRHTASLLPRAEGAEILDLGFGTGLELEYYFAMNPDARVTGIDMSRGMLDALRAKFPDRSIDLICDSYFDVDMGRGKYDAVVSVESLHHFTGERKLPLYRSALNTLKPGGIFVLTDYFAGSDAEERAFFDELARLQAEQGLNSECGYYHYDTPLTVEHEMAVIRTAGFSDVAISMQWGATRTLIARV